MTTRTTKQKWIVGNPRNIPQEPKVHLMTVGGKQLFEGDPFVRPAEMTDETFDGLVDRGAIVLEVTDG